MGDPNTTNKKVSYEIVKYGSGPWDGKWVVREVVQQDVAAVLTEGEANALAKRLAKGDLRP